MKIIIDKITLNKILDHYRNKAMEKFPDRIFTHAAQFEINTFIKQYQEHIIKRETHPGWSLPIRLIFDPRGCNMDVELDPQADVEIF